VPPDGSPAVNGMRRRWPCHFCTQCTGAGPLADPLLAGSLPGPATSAHPHRGLLGGTAAACLAPSRRPDAAALPWNRHAHIPVHPPTDRQSRSVRVFQMRCLTEPEIRRLAVIAADGRLSEVGSFWLGAGSGGGAVYPPSTRPEGNHDPDVSLARSEDDENADEETLDAACWLMPGLPRDLIAEVLELGSYRRGTGGS
jgi:hypothetical protein